MYSLPRRLLPPQATRDDIRSAFVRVARSTHPDKVGTTGSTTAANDAFAEVDEAWKILGDDQMRSAYDSFGFSGTDQGVPDFYGERNVDDTERVNMTDFAFAQPELDTVEPMFARRDAWP